MQFREFIHSPVFVCAASSTLASAAREMDVHNVGSLVVTDDDERVVGIITDRDVAVSIGRGLDVLTEVSRIMSDDVTTVPEGTSLDEAAATMDSHGIRRLPVVDEGNHPIGIVCLDDLYDYFTQEAITLFGAIRAQAVSRE